MNSNAKTIFYYIVICFSLMFCLYGTTSVLYSAIDTYYAGTPLTEPWDFTALTYAISSVIISGFALLFAYAFLRRLVDRGDVDNDYWLRQWVTYIIVGIAAVTFIWFSTTLFSGFLNATAGAEQSLKVLVNLGLASFIFVFFAYDLTSEFDRKKSIVYTLYGVGAAILLITVASGFHQLPSRSDIRAITLDSRNHTKVRDLRYAIDEYFREKEQLPQDLNVLIDQNRQPKGVFMDENTNELFIYNILDESSFELCTTFNKDYPGSSQRGANKAGKACFDFKL